MENTELERYQKLNKFQKEVVDALKLLGYKHKDFGRYEKLEHLDIDVSRIKSLSHLIETVYNSGKINKLWEVQRILGINN